MPKANSRARIVEVIRILSKYQGNTMLASMNKWEPWKIVISTILSARSKDETTLPVCVSLFEKYPTVEKLAAARVSDVEKIIKKTGFYKNKTRFIIDSARMIVKDFGGKVPRTLPELMRMPGVGRKVGNCVLVYAFGIPAIPVDTHVHRISNRLGAVRSSTPEETEIRIMKLVPQKYWVLYNDLLVWHGKNICKPIGPQCTSCPVFRYCRKIGVGARYYR